MNWVFCTLICIWEQAQVGLSMTCQMISMIADVDQGQHLTKPLTALKLKLEDASSSGQLKWGLTQGYLYQIYETKYTGCDCISVPFLPNTALPHSRTSPGEPPKCHCPNPAVARTHAVFKREGNRPWAETTRSHSWAAVDKALSVFLPLEPLTRPQRSRKLHVGTRMNSAHVTPCCGG